MFSCQLPLLAQRRSKHLASQKLEIDHAEDWDLTRGVVASTQSYQEVEASHVPSVYHITRKYAMQSGFCLWMWQSCFESATAPYSIGRSQVGSCVKGVMLVGPPAGHHHGSSLCSTGMTSNSKRSTLLYKDELTDFQPRRGCCPSFMTTRSTISPAATVLKNVPFCYSSLGSNTVQWDHHTDCQNTRLISLTSQDSLTCLLIKAGNKQCL